MSDPAKEICTTDPLDLEGLESFLSDDSQISLTENREKDNETHIVLGESQLILTIPEASQLLGIPISTLYRKRKQYKTITGADGKARLVLPNNSQTPLTNSRSENGNDASESQSSPANDESQSNSQSASGENQQPGDVFLRLIDSHTEQARATNKLIDYLMEQLKERDNHILLIPDLQAQASQVDELKIKLAKAEADLAFHKSGLWTRFTSWFLGKPGVV
jgi:hypothetical protein